MSFILRQKGYEKWACIASKGKDQLLYLSWGSIEKATSFDTVQELHQAFTTALDQMKTAAQKKADQLNAKGGVKQKLQSYMGHYYNYLQQVYPVDTQKDFKASNLLTTSDKIARLLQTHSPNYIFSYYSTALQKRVTISASELHTQYAQRPDIVDELFLHYGYVLRASQMLEHLPVWVQNIQDPTDYFNQNLLIESKAQSTNFLQTQNTYFVRSKHGWLGLKKGQFSFLPQMQQAYMFFDENAAKAAISTATHGYQSVPLKECALIKNQLIITQVYGAQPQSTQWMEDPEASALASGCEALSIEQAIEQAVQQRQQALESLKSGSAQQIAPPPIKEAKKRTRL